MFSSGSAPLDTLSPLAGEGTDPSRSQLSLRFRGGNSGEKICACGLPMNPKQATGFAPLAHLWERGGGEG